MGSTLFQTERTVVKKLSHSDFGHLYNIVSNPDVAKQMWGKPLTKDQTHRLIERAIENYEKVGYSNYGVQDKKTENFIGFCGFIPPREEAYPELVYGLEPAYFGMGMGSEVAIKMMDYGMKKLNFYRIVATVDPENMPSVKILSKCGFEFDHSGKDKKGLPTDWYILKAGPYAVPLQILFLKNAHPGNSTPMKRYMKDKFEFFGIKSVERKELTRKFLASHGLPAEEDYVQIIRELWDLPQRELQYAALDILERLLKKRISVEIEFLEYLIVTKSWWDTVDWLATRVVGVRLKQNPELITQTYTCWMESGNIWLQRVCIIFQLKYKRETDVQLLFTTIQALSGSKEFFIRKAIGWALREYSKTDPVAVQKFVDENELAPLSRREALKVINRR